MKILRSRNVISSIGSNLSCTDRVLYIFDKIKDSFTEIVVDDQKYSCNTCTCQKRNKDTSRNGSGAHYASQRTEQFNVSCTYHSKQKQNDKKQRYYASHSKAADSCNAFLPDTAGQSQKYGKQNPAIIDFRSTNIHNHGCCGYCYRKKVKKYISYPLQSYDFRLVFNFSLSFK